MAWFIWTKAVALARWLAAYPTTWWYPDTVQTKLRVQEIVSQIEKENWADLRQKLILPIRWVIPENFLEKGWKIVVKAFGPLESVDDPIITNGWWLTSVKVPVKFRRAEFGMLLQMNSAGSLVGLRFLSRHALGLGDEWKAPGYAGDSLRESEITLGKGKFKVGGTLCLPKATAEMQRFPCVVFLAGSGPCDRDSTVEENKPFKDLAWGLASHGIASIRFDKVSRTHPKAFRNKRNMTLTDEYVEHAVDAILQGQKHPEILSNRVFVLGHSLGAVVAPKIAATDASVAGCIIMAGPAEPIYRCLIRQLRYIESLDGPESLYINKQIDQAQAQAELADSDDLALSTPAKKLPFGIGPSYWLDYRNFDPIGASGSLNKPIIILQGGRDYQVTAQDDYQRWHTTLCERQNVQFHLYNKLNHLFVSGDGPSTPLEYSVPGNVDEQVIDDLSKWVLRTSK